MMNGSRSWSVALRWGAIGCHAVPIETAFEDRAIDACNAELQMYGEHLPQETNQAIVCSSQGIGRTYEMVASLVGSWRRSTSSPEDRRVR